MITVIDITDILNKNHMIQIMKQWNLSREMIAIQKGIHLIHV